MDMCRKIRKGRNLSEKNIQVFEKVIKKVANILNSIAVGLLFILMVQGAADVFGRYLFNKPILGTMERGQVFLGLMVLLSWGYTQIQKGHVSVDFFIAQLSPRTQEIINVLTTFMVFIFCCLIVWQGVVIAKFYHEAGRVMYVIHWPLALFQLFVPLAALIFCSVLFLEMITSLYRIKERK